jgi:hypothetical protein
MDKKSRGKRGNLIMYEENAAIPEPMYYIPTIEEFHVGFECEIMSSYGYQTGVWPDILSEETLNNFDEGHIIEKTKTSTFRIKYLDREDFESLGFERIDDGRFFKLGKPDKIRGITRNEIWVCRLSIFKKTHTYKIFLFQHRHGSGGEVELCKHIIIKNKSELIKLFKQLDLA